MRDYGMLSTPEAFHAVMRAFIRVRDVGGLIGCYKTMDEVCVKPTAETYHVLLDGLLDSGSYREASYAATVTWRMFKAEQPAVRPDADLLNKFVRCCRLCQRYDRAFVYLGEFNSFGLAPNFDTFKELLEVYRVQSTPRYTRFKVHQGTSE